MRLGLYHVFPKGMILCPPEHKLVVVGDKKHLIGFYRGSVKFKDWQICRSSEVKDVICRSLVTWMKLSLIGCHCGVFTGVGL